jgi:CRP/FNR family transcriptional regulator, cyclic AMP receptor protein
MATTEQDALAHVLRHCPRVTIEKGAALRANAFPDAKLFMVERGVAQVRSVRPGSKRPLVVAIAGAGAFLPSLLPQEELVGLTQSVVRFVPAVTCRMLLKVPTLGSALVDALLETLCERQEMIAIANASTLSERLRGVLCQLARAHGRVGPGGVEIRLPLTHELLAQMTGSARETVTMRLAALEQEGFLTRAAGAYRLPISALSLDDSRPLA